MGLDDLDIKKSWIYETLTLSMCADNSIVSKKYIFGSNLEHLPVFKPLRESNPEQLLVLKDLSGDDPRVEHLQRMDDPQVQSGTTFF